jgi:DNA polymerase (family 10)
MEYRNILHGDYHTHSIFSDGVNTYDELVMAAKVINLSTLAICDHSDEYMLAYNAPRLQGFHHGLHRWKNTINDIEVIRGLEIDLLDETGRISDMAHYSHMPSFIILSAHRKVYEGDSKTVTRAYVEAIVQNHKLINILGHPCSDYFGLGDEGIDIQEIVEVANAYGIGIEVNGANLVNKKTDLEKLKYVCKHAALLYLNSDAHTTFEMLECRRQAIEAARSFGRFSASEERELARWSEMKFKVDN